MRNAVQILLSSCPKRKLVGLYQVSCIILNYAYTPSLISYVLIVAAVLFLSPLKNQMRGVTLCIKEHFGFWVPTTAD